MFSENIVKTILFKLMRVIQMNNETLNLEEAARFLCMSTSALRQKTKTGEIKGAKPAKCWVYLKQDLVDHIRSKYTSPVEIPLSDSKRNKETLCRYINGKKSGGFVLQPQMDKEYAVLLGLETKSKRKSTTTS